MSFLKWVDFERGSGTRKMKKCVKSKKGVVKIEYLKTTPKSKENHIISKSVNDIFKKFAEIEKESLILNLEK